MDKEVGRAFLARVSEYLVSLPFDLKVLQEAVADPELDHPAREMAAGVVIHALSPHEGSGPERFAEDVILVRVTLHQISARGGDGVAAFRDRFAEMYGRLDEDLQVFQKGIGDDLWRVLCARPSGLSRLALKGKRPGRYVADEEAQAELYEDGLRFQTDYDVTEEQVRNRLRRPEQITEALLRRHRAAATSG